MVWAKDSGDAKTVKSGFSILRFFLTIYSTQYNSLFTSRAEDCYFNTPGGGGGAGTGGDGIVECPFPFHVAPIVHNLLMFGNSWPYMYQFSRAFIFVNVYVFRLDWVSRTFMRIYIRNRSVLYVY